MTGKRRARAVNAILRELEGEFEPFCATEDECIADKQKECPINRFRACVTELRAAIRALKASRP